MFTMEFTVSHLPPPKSGQGTQNTPLHGGHHAVVEATSVTNKNEMTPHFIILPTLDYY